MDNQENVFIKTVHNRNEIDSPYLVNFVGSSLEDSSDIQCEVYVDKSRKGNCSIIAKRRGVFHLGNVESQKDSLCQTLLLIRKKKKKKVKLVPVTICNFNTVNNDTQLPSVDTSTRQTSYSNLSDAFGSKRMKKGTSVMNKMISNSKVSEELVTDIVSGIAIDETDLTEDSVDVLGNIFKILPPCNRSASKIEDVYKVEDIITSIERATLNEAAQFFMDNPPLEKDMKSSFFLTFYYKALGNKLTLEKMQLMLFAHCLVTFFQIRSSNMKTSIADINWYSETVSQKILDEFTVGRKYHSRLSDKIICYVLVLAFLICDYQLNIEPLLSCFRGSDIKKLHLLLKCVGAQPLNKSVKNIFILKLPLPSIPKIRRKAIKKV